MRRNVVVLGLAMLMAASCSGAGGPVRQTANTTPVAATTLPTPTVSREAAASRYAVIETAYIKAYDTLQKKTFGTSQRFASYAQARSYYNTESHNLQRFEANVRAMTFPPDVVADVRVLLQRMAAQVVLMQDLAGRDDPNYGWQLNQQILKAATSTDAARVVVGEDLGLTYGP